MCTTVSSKTTEKRDSKQEESEKKTPEPSTISKEELLQCMEKVDREITQVEQHIVNLKKKQVSEKKKALKVLLHEAIFLATCNATVTTANHCKLQDRCYTLQLIT